MNKLKKFLKIIINFITSIPIYAYCLLSVGFIAYTIINPFKSNSEFFKNLIGLPKEWTFENIATVWRDGEFYKYYLNSVLVTVFSTIAIILVASLTAYGLSRFNFRFSKKVNSFFLMGLMFPANVMIVPLFLMARNLGLTNNFQGLVVIFTAIFLSFGIFILASFFKTLPNEVYEAAKIDGASEFRIFWRIMIPLARPVIGTLATIVAINVWNDYFISLIMIFDNAKRTVPLALANYFATYEAHWPLLFAALFITTIPIIIVYFIGSKQIVKGITAGAIK